MMFAHRSHLTGSAVRADPSTVSFLVLDNQIGGPPIPCDIAPGGEAVFVTELIKATALAEGGNAVDGKPQQIARDRDLAREAAGDHRGAGIDGAAYGVAGGPVLAV
ncbi:hypothetical protein, partial [Mycobacterium ostraviense]|uniref:hypothetical protein n=1 Tax=Mycobacterium ostraviense TaxID=2738409 RepID=UPI003B8A7DD3